MIKLKKYNLSGYFQNKNSLTKNELVLKIRNDFPSWSDNTINMYISRLKKEGSIRNSSRGIYKTDFHKTFNPSISQSIQSNFFSIKEEFPFALFCIWSSTWLSEFMLHQPFKNFMVVEVEKEVSEAVFNFLSLKEKHVFFNPDEEIFEHYIGFLNEDFIVVKNLVSEAPVQKSNGINIPSLEKILVDLLIDTELFSAQQDEIEYIYQSAFRKFDINEFKMKRYAKRRNKFSDVENLINISSAKQLVFCQNYTNDK